MAEKFLASSNFVHRKIADMDVLIAIGANIADFNGYIEMNPSAVLLWDQLQEPSESAELEQLLIKEYEIAPEQAQADTKEFLELLQAHKMVEVV